jgi:hypothetical protein
LLALCRGEDERVVDWRRGEVYGLCIDRLLGTHGPKDSGVASPVILDVLGMLGHRGCGFVRYLHGVVVCGVFQV